MDFKKLQEFINQEDRRLREKYNNYPDEEKRAYGRTVKLNEEVGELCEAVMGYYGKQRNKGRVMKYEEKLENELADVLISIFLLAKHLNIDISQAIERGIKKINKRYNK